MRIKLSRVFLIISISSMLVIGMVFGMDYNTKAEVIDVLGNRAELDEIAFVGQYMHDMYNSKEIIINNENIQEKNFSKQVNWQLLPTKKIKSNRDVLDSVYSESQIYEYENKFGSVKDYLDYDKNLDREIMGIRIEEKNLDNNKIKKYEIPLKQYNEGVSQISCDFIPQIYKDKLYVVAMESVYEYVDGKEGYGNKFKELLIEVYEIDLENKKANEILSKSFEQYNTDKGGRNSFKLNGKVYSLINEYENDGKNEEYGDLKILSYNIENNEIVINDIPKIASQPDMNNIHKVFVDEDKAYLVGEFFIDEENLINLTIGEIDSNDDEIKIIKKQIKTSNIELKGEEKISSYSYDIGKIKFVDGKLYMSWRLYIDKPDEYIKLDSYINLMVADSSTDEVLYEGKLKEDKFSINRMNIVKKEDL